MTYACLKAILSHWRCNPLQLFALVAGLAIATALWSGVQAINSEARSSYKAAATVIGDSDYDQLVPKSGNSIPQDIYVKLRRSGWLVTPIIEGVLSNTKVLGIDSLTSPSGLGVLLLADMPLELSFSSKVLLFANSETAEALKDVAEVLVNPAIATGIAVGDVGTVQKLLNRDDLSRLLVLKEQPLGRKSLVSVAPELLMQPSHEAADITQLTDSFHLNLTAFGLLSFLVGSFIVYSTVGLAFERRRGMIRTLRSLGIPLRLLVKVMIVEMLTLTLVGAVLGIVLGYVIAALLLPDVAATLRGLYGAQISGTLHLRPEWWISGLAICFLGSAAAFAGRIFNIWRMPILTSAKPRAWATISNSNLLSFAVASIVLFGISVLLIFLGTGLFVAFTILACILIAAALSLPPLISITLSFIQSRSHSPILGWFWSDTRHQLPGLNLALMALLLAISANVGVATMVSSFRLTFIDFLNQRLAPELFIEVDNAAKSSKLETYLLERKIEVLPLLIMKQKIADQPVLLFGIRVSQTYRDNWQFLDSVPNAWDLVASGSGAVINEQLARRAGLKIGDYVTINQDFSLLVTAIVGDYGNPKGQIVASEHVIKQLKPDIYAAQFGIRSSDANALRQQITIDLDIPRNSIINQAEIKAMSMEVFERTFTVTRALNLLTLSIAAFALLMSLLTLADIRIPQLAPLWSLGLTRRQLFWLELIRCFALSVLVFGFALPLGLTLAWLLLNVVNVEAFGWRLPMYLFPAEYIKLAFYALMASLLASAWPAIMLIRTPASSLLKVFANER